MVTMFTVDDSYFNTFYHTTRVYLSDNKNNPSRQETVRDYLTNPNRAKVAPKQFQKPYNKNSHPVKERMYKKIMYVKRS